MQGYLSMALDIDGVVAVAQHYHDPDILKATFPGLTDEQVFMLLDDLATLTRDGPRVRFDIREIH